MKTKHVIILLILILATAGFAIYFLKEEKQKLESENEELRSRLKVAKAQLDAIRKTIESDDEIDLKVRKKLLDLITQYQIIDPNITAELVSATNLINAKEHVKAAFSLAKIVENLLKDKYHSDPQFAQYLLNPNGKKRRPNFNEYLDYAKKLGDIEPEDHHFAKGLKEIRNQAGHQPNVQKENSFLHTALYSGIGLIIRLTKPIFPPTTT